MPQQKSAAFVRIKSEVLKIVAAIPEGKLITHRAVGEHLDVMPRHVAYILAMLTDQEKATYPWHRIVSDDGSLGTLKRGVDGRPQAALLEDEGYTLLEGKIVALPKRLVSITSLKSGVPKQTRPAVGADQPAGNAARYKYKAR